jgi:ribonuclease H2 subunit C
MQIQLESIAVEKEIDVHLVPCHIAYNGPSNVSGHFIVREDQETQTSVSSFRGRKLCGRRVQLPQNYTGKLLSQRKLT